PLSPLSPKHGVRGSGVRRPRSPPGGGPGGCEWAVKGSRTPRPARWPGSALGELEHLVFLAGVGPVLELDDAELLEALAQPPLLAVGGTGIEQAELLAVRHDLREQHRLEQLTLRRGHHERQDGASVDLETVPHLLLQEAVTHPHRRLEGELLTLTQLGT